MEFLEGGLLPAGLARFVRTPVDEGEEEGDEGKEGSPKPVRGNFPFFFLMLWRNREVPLNFSIWHDFF